MCKILLFNCLLLTTFLSAQSIEPKEMVKDHFSQKVGRVEYDIFAPKSFSRKNVPEVVKDYTILELDRVGLAKIVNTKDVAISLTIPTKDRSNLTLQLVEVKQGELVIKTASNKKVNYEKGRHFRGIVKGQENSVCALSFFGDDVMGFISQERNEGNLVIGKMNDGSGDFILYKDYELLKNIDLNCQTADSNIPYTTQELQHSNNSRDLTDCVRYYFEVDHNIFLDKGGINPSINYVTALFNQVSTLYANESINTSISEILVWDVASPYIGPSTADLLNQFEANNNGFNGDLAMLLTYTASGGIAYVNTLCNPVSDYKLGVSSIASTFSTIPTYSWSVEVITHESGHIMGSQHTHACVWNGNNTAIDGCFTIEGNCANPGLPPSGGTIMSYCHITSAGINFSLGFGIQPGNVIRNAVTNAACLNPCGPPQPTCSDGIQNGDETGIDCGGSLCPACPPACNGNAGTLTLVLDSYPEETSWEIRNSSNVLLYSGSAYSAPNQTLVVQLCLPNDCYNFTIFDAYGDGICCAYGNGSYNIVFSGTNVATGGTFGGSETKNFCLSAAPSCTDGIQNGNETGIDCGGSCPSCQSLCVINNPGSNTLCIGNTTQLSSPSPNGTWLSSDVTKATVSNTGLVTAIGQGSAQISYSAPSCSVNSITITVNALPTVSLNGTNQICTEATRTLTFSPAGGTWTSSNNSVATVSAVGVVTAVAAGSATFTYTAAGCSATTPALNINTTPTVGLNGSNQLCTGLTRTLTFNPSGGTWTSSNTAVATISNAGVVTAVAAGAATFTYTVNGCAATTPSLTIVTSPTVGLNGTNQICTGATRTLTFSPAGGTWSSSNTSVATVSGAGVVTAVAAGAATFTYTASGCSATTPTLNINTTPTVGLNGTNQLCSGLTRTLTFNPSGGTWTSSNTAVATVSNAGVVTAVAAGAATFTYTVNGCSATTPTLTIIATPTVGLNGTNQICTGTTRTLTFSPTGGAWTSSNTAVATVSNAGLVTAVAAGAATFTYTAAGCSATTAALNINTTPTVGLNGSNQLCSGLTRTLTFNPSGGTWTSSNTAVATVSNAGVVTGVAAGNATFTYTVSGCSAATPSLTIVNSPTVGLNGTNQICTGVTRTLTFSPAGGTWTSSNTAVATVSNAGLVTAVAAGAATFTYTAAGCSATTAALNINPTPTVGLNGSNQLCSDMQRTLTFNPSGGTWTSSNTAVATVSNAGVVTGVAAGNATFTYTVSGCASTTPSLTIVITPTVGLNGSNQICTGATRTLTFSPAGGTWTSSNVSIATISAAGVVTAIAAGSPTFTYTAAGCSATTAALNINPTPTVDLNGSNQLCAASTRSLTFNPSGGTWASSNTAVATVSNAGVVTGVAAGNATFTYTVNGCSATTSSLSIVALPIVDLNGSNQICTGASRTLTYSPTGGTWTSNNAAVAEISALGEVSAVSIGSATFTYIASGCASTTDVINVNVSPIVSINGSNQLCVGLNRNLLSNPILGTWTSSNPSIATVSNEGLVTAISTGSVNFTFTSNANGCSSTTESLTIINNPIVDLNGLNQICTGSTRTLNFSPAGGTWTSSNQAIATVSVAGVVNAISAGTVSFTYTSGGCSSTTNELNVNLSPSIDINGSNQLCVGLTRTLISSPVTGAWSSNNPSAASVTSGALVTGISSGTATFTFTAVATGCATTSDVITIISTPTVGLNGSNELCFGGSRLLSSNPAGGSWTSNNATVATVNPNGLVNALTLGNVDFTYTVGGCNSTTPTLTIISLPSADLTGGNQICVGATKQLIASPVGGTWTSNNGAIATVDQNGLVSGIASGNVTFTYEFNGCEATTPSLTINDLPEIDLNGSSLLCNGSTRTLSFNPAGGTWSSSNNEVATISQLGEVTAVSLGTVTFTYSSNGCNATTSELTIFSTPTVGLGGDNQLCLGSNRTLSFSPEGGSWASSNVAIATVSEAGIVSSVSNGNVSFSYSINGCSASTQELTIVETPTVDLNGGISMCIETYRTLTFSPAGGSWSSSNQVIAAISALGEVTALSEGSVSFTYTANGCSATTPSLNINVLPTVNLNGSNQLCLGSTRTLIFSPEGGTWLSNNASVATISAEGVVSTLAQGIASFTYTKNGCNATTSELNVQDLPSVGLNGAPSICTGASRTLTFSPAGGTWTSSNPNVASISSLGEVTGLSEGSAGFTYIANGCSATTASLTINTIPTADLNGSNQLCVGSARTLTFSPEGGTWVSSNETVAIVSQEGVVSTLASGIASFTYTKNGCSASTAELTVISLPTVGLNGGSSLCVDATRTLTFSPGGGTWTSSNPNVASISSLGVVTGLSAGSASFTYTANGCSATTASLSIYAIPTADLNGSNQLCVGSTRTLTFSPEGGTWVSSNETVATVSQEGVVSTLAQGIASFTYTKNGCSASTAELTVISLPTVGLNGGSSLCVDATRTLTFSPGGGTWTSSNPNVASISSLGVVTGLSAGSASFTYISNGCSATTALLTINALPTVDLNGSNQLCLGSTRTLTYSPPGGTWVSNNAAVATVSAGGLVTAITAGNASFTYSLNGCSTSTANLTVIANPVVGLNGSTSLCSGVTRTLSFSPAGGSWESSNTAVATVSAIGVVTGVSAGTATFTYTVNGCSSITPVLNIIANPTVGLNGSNQICIGLTRTLTFTPTGGTWLSNSPAIASVTNAGLVTAISVGSATFTYTANGCSATTSALTVTAVPTVGLNGTNQLCVGATRTLTSSPTGGTFTSSNPAVASISSNGVVTGIASGSATFTYNLNGCSATTPALTILAAPTVGLNGSNQLCIGTTRTLTFSPTGGTWVTSNAAIATVSAAGLVTPVSTGNVTFTYTVSGCSTTTPIMTINASATVSLNGSNQLCMGSTRTLTASPTGGSWTSSNTAIATVGSTSGIVTPVSVGSVTFTYNAGGCSATTPALATKALPIITVPAGNMCVGGATKTLTASVTGGTWVSNNPTVASINVTTGVVTALTPGTATFTYTAPASGGSCVSAPSATVTVESNCATLVAGYYFETGWDNWVDGGIDADRITGATGTTSYEGVWSIRLRDNSNVPSAMTSANLALLNYQSVKIELTFKMVGMENAEDFWIRVSTNGTTYTTVGTYAAGTTYLNNNFYTVSVILNKAQYGLNNTTTFRIQADGSDDTDIVYIDAVKITGFTTAAQSGTPPTSSIIIKNESDFQFSTYKAYPNPATNILNVEIPDFGDTDHNIELFDINGKAVFTKKAEKGLNRIELNDYHNGMYLIRVSSIDGVKYSHKLIIQN